MPKGRTTLAEIADAAGVSVATVSKVLNDRAEVSPETRRRVQKHLRDSKYRPAGSSSARPRELTRAIEVVVPELQSPYVIAVLKRHYLVRGSRRIRGGDWWHSLFLRVQSSSAPPIRSRRRNLHYRRCLKFGC